MSGEDFEIEWFNFFFPGYVFKRAIRFWEDGRVEVDLPNNEGQQANILFKGKEEEDGRIVLRSMTGPAAEADKLVLAPDMKTGLYTGRWSTYEIRLAPANPLP